MSFLKSEPDADLKTVLRMDTGLGEPFAAYHQALLRGPSPFSVAERELMGAYVSGLNACDFCLEEHDAVAQRFGISPGVLKVLMDDLETAPVSEALRAVLVFLKKLNDTPSHMVAADAAAVHAAGWDDMALYHAVAICGLFNFNNRIIQGLGIPAHGPEKLDATADRLHAQGYDSTLAFVRGEWQEAT